MKLTLNTNLLPIVDVGMYESFLSPSHVFGDWLSAPGVFEAMTHEEIEYCETISSECFNTQAYKKLVAKYALEVVVDFFKNINDVVKVTLHSDAQIHSPKYYNFNTDVLDFEIEIEEYEIQKIKDTVKGNQIFIKWLKETYKSYPGFICFMPRTEETFKKDIEGKDIDRALAAYFTFLLRIYLGCSGKEEFGNEYKLYERISSDHAIGEFVEDERFHEIMNRVHETRRVQ